MKTPAWSRLRVSFGEKVRAAFLTVTVFGSIIRIENVVPESWSFLLSDNKLFSWITFGQLSASAVELTYLASIAYLSALGVFLYALPRDIQITTSREDYVKRSLKALNALNIREWLQVYLKQNENHGPIASQEVISHLTQYEAYCAASMEAGREVDFDKSFKVHIIQALQHKYNHYNKEAGLGLRRLAFGLLLTSSTVGAIAVGDSVIRTLFVIFCP